MTIKSRRTALPSLVAIWNVPVRIPVSPHPALIPFPEDIVMAAESLFDESWFDVATT